MSKNKKNVQALRLDENRIKIENDQNADILLFANEDVPLDKAGILEIGNLAALQDTLLLLSSQNFLGMRNAMLHKIRLTPDFHKGSGIPVGSVIETEGVVFPRAIGNDIGCGMRLLSIDVTKEEFESLGNNLDAKLRHTFFEGGRDIPMSQEGREAMLTHGIAGLQSPPDAGGIWNFLEDWNWSRERTHSHDGGSWKTPFGVWAFKDFIRGSGGVSRDAAIASVGKGNHFVEIGWVDECLDRNTCWNWGLKRNYLTLMIHTGSVDLGASVGSHFMRVAKEIYPSSLARPEHGFYPLPTLGDYGHIGQEYLSAMALAANFAICNRMMLASLAVSCLSQALGRRLKTNLVYDAPHNLIWSDKGRSIHRKGACPADWDENNPAFPDGHPVIVPGSMGDASFLLKSQGSSESLYSAPHGAGRKVSRGEGRRANPSEMKSLRVVTKLDLSKVRKDIAQEYLKSLLEEAPSHYKPVLPAMRTVSGAGIASPVAKLLPLLTIKA